MVDLFIDLLDRLAQATGWVGLLVGFALAGVFAVALTWERRRQQKLAKAIERIEALEGAIHTMSDIIHDLRDASLFLAEAQYTTQAIVPELSEIYGRIKNIEEKVIILEYRARARPPDKEED